MRMTNQTMNKKFLLFLIPAAMYVVLSIAGLGISGRAGTIIYRAVIIVYLLLACTLAFKGAGRGEHMNPAVLIGALGLGLFAVNEIYLLAHIYLLGGNARELTVANFARNCAYLFFMAAILSLSPADARWKKHITAAMNILSTAAIIIILYGIVADNPYVLYYSALILVSLSIWSALCLLLHKAQKTKPLAYAVIAVCVIDTANLLMYIFTPAWHWHDIVVSLYPVVYLLLGFSLFHLREGDMQYE